jgi:hypothetical protein
MPGFRPAWLIVTEMGIDTRMPMGKAMAHMARVFAELERDPRTPLGDLNNDAVPTAQGARAWSQATVRALLMREGVH